MENKAQSYAKEAYLKLGNMKGLLELYMRNDNWNEAFIIAKQNVEFMDMIKLPYAEYLCKIEKYEDALKVYKSCNRLDLSEKMLRLLSEQASKESRHRDAARLYWEFGLEHLSYVSDA